MKNILLILLLVCSAISLHGCAAGSATAAYAMKAGMADEVSPNARESIIKEAVERCRK